MADPNQPRVAFLTANEGVEQVEFTQPWQAVLDAGATADLIAPEPGTMQAFHHLDKADVFEVDVTLGDADANDYDMLVLPGGVANPDQLRLDDHAVAFVQSMLTRGAPVAAICHAPWMLVEADAVRDRKLTSFPSVRTDIANAGGEWTDAEVVVCDRGPGPLITSRNPDDLPAFGRAIADALAAMPSRV